MAALILATEGAGLACKGGGSAPPKTGTKSFKVAVIPKGLTHEFWKSGPPALLQGLAEKYPYGYNGKSG